jgi:hypothetical protein
VTPAVPYVLWDPFEDAYSRLAAISTAEPDAAWQEIGHELRAFEGPDGFEGPCELIVEAASKPA